MSHLAPYAKNMVDKDKHVTQMTKYFSELNMAVDFLHFKVKNVRISLFMLNHVGKNCQTLYTPHQFPAVISGCLCVSFHIKPRHIHLS